MRSSNVVGFRALPAIGLMAVSAAMSVASCRRPSGTNDGGVVAMASARDTVALRDPSPSAVAAAPTNAAPEGGSADASRVQATIVKTEPHTMSLSGKVPVEIRYPGIVTTSASATEALRQRIEGELTRRRAAFLREAASEDYPNCKEGPVRSNPGGASCELSYVCEATLARGRGVSVLCNGYEGLGGAHPTKLVFALNYALEGEVPRALQLDDVAVDRAAKKKLLRRAVTLLEKEHGEGLASDIDSDALARGRGVVFNVVPEGIRITFDSFPFVIGPLAVTLRRSDIEPLIKRDVLDAFR